jgi:hypothetical protein
MFLIDDIRADAARQLQISNVITRKVGTQIRERWRYERL